MRVKQPPRLGVRAEPHERPRQGGPAARWGGGVVRLPAPAPELRTVVFPALMAVAPVVVSLALWLLLRSPAMLAFALFGPVMAVASYLQAKRQARRDRAQALAAFEDSLSATLEDARLLTAQDLGELQRSAPGARSVLAGVEVPHDVEVALGFGVIASRVRVEGEVRELPVGVRESLDTLLRHQDAPVLADGTTMRLSGSRRCILAIARALLVQHLVSPQTVWLGQGEAAAELGSELDSIGVEWRVTTGVGETCDLLIAFEGTKRGASAPTDSASRPGGPALRLYARSTRAVEIELLSGARVVARPELVTAEELRAFCQSRFPELAATSWPSPVSRSEPRGHPETSVAQRTASLFAELGTSRGQPYGIDLVRSGPHAVVGGTTGSGKSELLVTWVLEITAQRSTREVQILCFDFKGGATFDPIGDLPHCVGIVTDLDEAEARRAATSLGAELRARELALRSAKAKHIGELAGLPRLVIVVDEYQALLASSAELQSVFADISARGRSLGVHLVLCAQQPATAVRGSTLSNCSIRICLRVVAEVDSQALLGTVSAAQIRADAPGSAICVAGDKTAEVQVYRSLPGDIYRRIEAAVEREGHLGLPPPQPPWLPALPVEILLADLQRGDDGLTFGLTDNTETRRQPPAKFRATDGAVVVVGGPRTGKTGALAGIAWAARASQGQPPPRVVVVGSDPEAAWDQLWRGDLTAKECLLILDNVDELLGSIDEPHRTALTERLLFLLRHSASGRPAVVFSVSRVTGTTSGLVAAAAQTLRLVGGDRNVYVMAGGEAADHRVDAPPGRGIWQGHPCQVAWTPHPLRPDGALPTLGVEIADLAHGSRDRDLIVVARRGAPIRRALESEGILCIDFDAWRLDAVRPGEAHALATTQPGPGRAVIGDVEAWQTQFGLLARLAAQHTVLLAGVTPSEHRLLLRGDQIPPFVTDASRSAVVRDPEGGMTRVRWADPGAVGQSAAGT